MKTPCSPYKEYKSVGYAQSKRNGVVRTVPRWIIIDRHGEEYCKGKVARHLCGNRWCINPEHIVAGTRRENMLDDSWKIRGERHCNNKLSEKLAWLIKYSFDGFSHNQIASICQVKRQTIGDIRTNRTWSWL